MLSTLLLARAGTARLTLVAQAGVLRPAEQDELWRRAENSASRLVALEAKRRRFELEALD